MLFSPPLSLRMTPSAGAPILFKSCVFRGKFMAPFAMSLCSVFCGVCRPSESKTGFIKMFDWAKYFFGTPSKLYSLVNSLVRNTKFFRPVHCSQCLPLKSDKFANAPVFLLLFSASPATVLRGIPLFIVNSFNRVMFGRVSHVRIKNGKTIDPFVAYRNSTASVSIVKTAIRIKTSLFHAAPNRICSIIAKSVFFSHNPSFKQVSASPYHKLGGYSNPI